MAPYFEVDGRPDQSPPVIGIPLPEIVKERKMSPGEEVILIKPHSIWSGDSGSEVLVKILSDKKAIVRVKTDDSYLEPSKYLDKDKPEALWFGGNYAKKSPFNPESSVRKLKQKTFKVDSKTIFTNSPKRVEWRKT